MLLLAGAAHLPLSCPADVVPAPLFADGAVLQRDKPVVVWGMASPDESVKVEFGGNTTSATADVSGGWTVLLPALPANRVGADLVIAGTNTVTIHDVLVGEVWLCSGQSNMEWPVSRSTQAGAEIAGARFPLIRHIKIAREVAEEPQSAAQHNGWTRAIPEEVGAFSAIGYFFARDIHLHLDVPVGLINSTWGGTPIEAWSSREALAASPEFQRVHDHWARWIAGYPARVAAHEQAVAEYRTREDAARAGGEEALAAFRAANRPPRPPTGHGSQDTPSGLFNAMIAPLVPYGIRGTLWYQGEANTVRADDYRDLFIAMITDWRTKFRQGDLPFYWVQLANFADAPRRDAAEIAWARLREAQSQTLVLPNTAQAVIVDIGENSNIHPRNKQEVGRRLASIALNRIHGRTGDAVSGPVFAGVTRDGARLRVGFDHAEGGLVARDGPVRELEIAGDDRVFHPAHGEIVGSVLVAWSPEVDAPVAVRHAFRSALDVNLFGSNGLPVAPFRSDSW
jgi:sialate O-acetylesterase